MAWLIAAVAASTSARSFQVANCLRRWLRIRLDSAVNRLYRFLKNPRVDDTLMVQCMTRQLLRPQTPHLLISIDWTEWPRDLRMLSAAVVAGKRGIPIWCQVFPVAVFRRSQNSRENTFLRVLADALKRAQAAAVILCDRGFRRVSWLKLLQKLELDFVVRLKADVAVTDDQGNKRCLGEIPLMPGKPKNLGVVPLRSDGAIAVRVIGYRAKGHKDPWWLATSLTGPAWQVLKTYDRRMTVEEQFRDTKGKRFGVKLAWTAFRSPDALARFALLVGVAMLIWYIAGRMAAAAVPSLRLPCRRKGPRQSYITIGIREIDPRGGPPRPVARSCIQVLLEQPELRKVGRHGFGRAK
jgi:hypothetical protein